MNEDYGRSTLTSPYRNDISRIYCNSQPYCIFRNHSRNIYQGSTDSFDSSFRSKWLKNKKNHLKMIATNQTISYQQVYKDAFIPFGLLKETIELDLQDSFDQSFTNDRLNSLTSFLLGSGSYLLHAGGKNMDELIVRNTNFLLPQYCYPVQPSFALNLGHGAPIKQVITAGRTDYGTCVNLLVRNRAEIFYLQAIEIDDLLENGQSIPCTCVLEPKAKWQLPEDISDLAGSSSSSYLNEAVAISKSGKLFSWNPIQGMKKHSDVQAILPAQDSSLLLDLTCQPGVVYIVNATSVYNHDLRSCQTSKLHESESRVTTIKQHLSNPYQYMISNQKSLMLFDSRYAKQHVYKQFIPEPYDLLSHQTLVNFAEENSTKRYLDLFLGGSHSSASNLQLHYINDRSQVVPNRNRNHSAKADSSRCFSQQKQFSSLFSPFSTKNLPSWKTESIPLIDTTQRLIGLEIVLINSNCAFNLSRAKEKSKEDEATDRSKSSTASFNSSDNETEEEDSNHDSQKFTVPAELKHNFCALVVQQVQGGDVYAQQISWGDIHYEEIVLAETDQQSYHSDSSLTASSAFSAKPVYTFSDTNAYFDEEDDEGVGLYRYKDVEDVEDPEQSDENSEETTEATITNIKGTNGKSPQRSPQKASSRKPSSNLKGKNQPVHHFARRLVLPPVSWCGPIGTRHFLALPTLEAANIVISFLAHHQKLIASGSDLVAHSNDSKFSLNSSIVQAFQNLQFYFKRTTDYRTDSNMRKVKRMERKATLSSLQLSLQQLHMFDITADERYPLSSFTFLQYLPKDGLLPYDVFQFHLLDLRLDLPILPKPPNLLTMKSPAYQIQNNLQIIFDLFKLYQSPLQHFFSIYLDDQQPLFHSKATPLKIFRTLYEIWEKLFQLSNYRIDLRMLRIALNSFSQQSIPNKKHSSSSYSSSAAVSSFRFVEKMIPSRFDISRNSHNSFYSDGVYVDKRTETDSSSSSSDEEGDDKDDEDTHNNNQDKEPSGKRHKPNHPNTSASMESESSESENSFYNVSGLLPKSKAQDVKSGLNLEGKTSEKKKVFQSLDSKYYGCQYFNFSDRRQSIDELWENHKCQKRDCLLSHRFIYSLDQNPSLSAGNDPINNHRHAKKSTAKNEKPFQISDPKTPNTNKHTDITSDLISILSERWEQTITNAFPIWNHHQAINLYNHSPE